GMDADEADEKDNDGVNEKLKESADLKKKEYKASDEKNIAIRTESDGLNQERKTNEKLIDKARRHKGRDVEIDACEVPDLSQNPAGMNNADEIKNPEDRCQTGIRTERGDKKLDYRKSAEGNDMGKNNEPDDVNYDDETIAEEEDKGNVKILAEKEKYDHAYELWIKRVDEFRKTVSEVKEPTGMKPAETEEDTTNGHAKVCETVCGTKKRTPERVCEDQDPMPMQ
ncbi:11849_t:CDS:2, partial [Dentiscutata erythropus]